MCPRKRKKKPFAKRIHKFTVKFGVFVVCMIGAGVLLIFIGNPPGTAWMIEHGLEYLALAWSDIVGEA